MIAGQSQQAIIVAARNVTHDGYLLGLAEAEVNTAYSNAGQAAGELANANALLSAPSVVDQVIKWGGIGAGVLAVATGGASAVLEVLGYTTAAAALGTTATVAGAVAASSDTAQCIQGDQEACFTAGLGWVATGLSGYAAVGAMRGADATEAYEYCAFAIGARTSGFFGSSVAITQLVVDAEAAALNHNS